MRRILKDPLVHFLALGVALFVLFEVVGSDDAAYDSKVINVDRDVLLTFLQYRARAFEPGLAAEHLDKMSDAELEKLIGDYVRVEALHREALSLGVDKNDYVIKRRMIQSIKFITDGLVTAVVEISDEDIADYYEANRDDYYVEPYVTFTHIFYSSERHGREEAIALAQTSMAELNARQAAFSEAPRHGDRFPFFLNYVERDPAFVASHFGTGMAQDVFALEPSDAAWYGPFESEYGAHLVMLTRKTEGRYPDLSEIKGAVRDDAEREAIAEQKSIAIQAIVDTYEVRTSLERQAATGSAR